jgi:hypothetical protein
MQIQQAIVHQFLHRTKELLFIFSMIPFLDRNDENVQLSKRTSLNMDMVQLTTEQRTLTFVIKSFTKQIVK